MNQNYNFVQGLFSQVTNSRNEETKFNSTKKQTFVSFLMVLAALFTFIQGNSQVTTNGGSGLATSYSTLADAVTALNTATISSPVTITLTASETAPAGGYNITATGTSVNTITFLGGGFTVTAPAQTAGNINDAIFKIIGGDYITIQNFTLSERVFTPVAADYTATTNTMTEFGVALFYASLTDGAQNNTIQNNVISLNRVYTSTFGIYSNTRHSATAVTTSAEVTAATGSNSNNKIYTNSISNVNYGIVFIGAGTTLAAIDSGNDIGGSSSATGNTITNWGGSGAASSFVSLTGNNYCIFSNQQINDNISYNSITSGSLTSSVSEGGILKNYSIAPPTATSHPTGFTTSINNNTVTVTNNPTAATTGSVIGINNQGLTALLSTVTVNINNNIVQNCVLGGSTSTTNGITAITNLSLPGTLNMTGNSVIGNAITATTATTGVNAGIANSGAAGTVNMNNNIVRSLASTATSGQIQGVVNSGAAVTAVNINGNALGNATSGYFTTSTATSGTLFGISNSGSAATCALSIQNNDIRGITYNVAASATQTYIVNAAVTLSQNISSNTFTNLNVNTTGSVTFISNSVTVPATGTQTINSNSIVTAFNKAGVGGTITLCTSSASSVAGATITHNNNNFSNITVTGATIIAGWVSADGGTANKTYNGNTFNNWIGGSSAITGMSCSYGGGNGGNGNVLSNNVITNITGTGVITGINLGSFGTTHTANNNTITGLSSTGTGGAVTGIASAAPTGNIFSNIINTLSSTSTTATVAGITSSGVTANIFQNTINTLSCLGTTSGVTNGIMVTAGTLVNVYRNKIYDLSTTGAFTPVAGVNGILMSGGTTVNTYNNLVGDLKAAAANSVDAIRGLSVTSTTTLSNYNLYNNSVYLNATSSGAAFGTTGIFHTTSATATTAALDLRNNIVFNTSTPGTTGVVTALRRSSAAVLGNFATTSNRNMYFAGTAAANRTILTDGTNFYQTYGTYFTAVGATREVNSFVENITPATFFTSTSGSNANYLQPASGGANTQCESGGSTIAITSPDYNGVTRPASPGSFYDIGAWEFNGTTPAPTISNFTVTPAGGQCVAVSHAISATVTSPTGTISAVTLNYSFNSVAQTPITMTNSSGNVWTGTIPAATTPTNTNVTWSVTATNSLPLTTTLSGAGYQDEANLGTIAVAAASVTPTCAGSPTVLTASLVRSGTSTTIGSGTAVNSTSSNIGAFYGTYWGNSRSQILITAAELNAAGLSAGNITALKVNVTGGTLALCKGFTIKIGATTATSITGAFATPTYTTVYGPTNYTPTSGVNTHTFTTPFSWDGTSNILVDYCYSNAVTGTSSATNTTTTTSFASTVLYGADGTTAACGNTTVSNSSSIRANIILVGNTAPVISSVSWTNNRDSSTASTNGVSVSPTTSTTYTASVTANGCVINPSATVTVTVNPLPSAPTATNSTQCGLASPSCSVTSTSGAASPTYKWYTVASGGTAIAGQTGASLSSYPVSSSTNFYVSEVGANGCESFPRTLVSVSVNSPDPVSITPSLTNICLGSAVSLTGAVISSTNGNNYTTSFSSTANSGALTPVTGASIVFGTSRSVSVTPTAVGTYIYTLTVNDSAQGCATSATSVSVTVTGGPDITTYTSSPTIGCVGSTVTLAATSISGGAAIKTLGAGAATAASYDGVFYHLFGGNKSQFIIPASELTSNGLSAGNITSLGINIGTAGAVSYAGFAISMGQTSTISNLSGGIYSGAMSTVYSSVSETISATGIKTYTLTPFTWDGTSNLIVQFCWSNNNGGGTSSFTKNDPTAYVSCAYYRADSLSSTSICGGTTATSTTSTRPQFIIGGQSATNVTSSYDWSWNSTPVIAAATGTTVLPASASTTYTVTATNRVTGCTSTKNVVVNTLPLPTAPTVTNSSQCGVGGSPTAQVADPNTFTTPTFKWYTTSTGGTAIQTSTSNTLLAATLIANPLVLGTNNYWVSVTNPTTSCESSRTNITVNVASSDGLVAASTQTANVCLGSSITISYSQTGTIGNVYTTSWSSTTGSGLTNGTSANSIVVTPTAVGTYAYSINGSEASSGCSASSSVIVTVINPLGGFTASAVSSSPVVCNGSSTILTASLASPITASIGVGARNSTTYPNPFYTNWGHSKNQYLILASELIAQGISSGNINSLSIEINSGTTSLTDFSVQMANSTAIDMSSFVSPSFTSVYSNPSLTPVVGLNTLTFTTPFVWDGTSNVIIQTCFGNANTTTVTSSVKADNTAYISVAHWNSTSTTSGSSTCGQTTASATYTIRPKFTFEATNSPVVTSYSWSNGANVIGTTNPITVSPTSASTYTVNITSLGCSKTAQVSVTTQALPNAPSATDAIQCGNQLSAARVSSNTGLTNPIFVWYNVASGGISVQSGISPTFLTAINSTRTMYVSEYVGACESVRTPVVMTVTPPPAVTITSSVPTFCGTGGNTTLTASSSDPGMSYTWSSFTPTASITSNNTAVTTATISETSEFKVVGIATNPSCLPIESYISVGVYPLPSATVTSTAQGVCPGTSATIGSGLSAGNFTVTCIPAPSGGPASSPVGAVSLVAGQVAQSPYPAGVYEGSFGLDDNYWGGIPVGFNFNFFGNTVTSVFIGTNGTINLGTTGSSSYTFAGFPSASSPASTIAVVARDLDWGSTGAGKITYWTEGIAPNRRFIVQFLNGTTWDTDFNTGLPLGKQTAEAVFYETLGTIDIRVFEATYNDAKYIGLQDATRLIGASAPNCDVTPPTANYWNGQTAIIPATAPKAWRFSPPSNYSTTWYANGVAMPSVTANPTATPPVVGYNNPGTNVFSIPVAPAATTTYSITYTNQTTGCSNAAGSAQVVMAVLGNTIPSGLTTIASSPSICYGGSVNLSTSYTGITDQMVFQWQNSTDGGTTWNDIASANALTYSDSPLVPTQYRCKMIACNGVPGYTSPVTVGFTNTVNSTTPGLRCGTGTATISAVGSTGTTVNWFDNATGGASIGTGTSFVTPTISSTTTFYAEASTIGGAASVGPVSPSAQGGIIGTQTIAWDVNFTVLAATTLQSVTIFPQTSGNSGTLTIRNGSGSAGTIVSTINYTTTVGGGATPQVININTPLTAGNYAIYTDTLPAGGISRNTTNATYPYTSSVANITSNGFSTAYFMGLYDWKFESACLSPRVPVIVTVTPAPTLVLSGDPATICAESNTTPVTVTTGASNYSSFVWTPTSVTGNSTTGWVFNPLTTTTYTLAAAQTTGATPCVNTATVTVNVNPTPSVITIAPATASTCTNTILPLVATGGVISPDYVSSMDILPTDFTVNNPNVSTVTSNTTYYSEGTGSILFNVSGVSANAKYSMNTDLDMTASTSATLTFSHIAAMEGSFTSYDYGYVEYSVDGGTTWINFTPSDYAGSADATVFNANARFSTKSYGDWIAQFTSDTSDPGVGPATSLWKRETFNIPASALTSTQFRVRFRYTTDSSTNYYGWLIDNVRVNKSSPTTLAWSPRTNLYTDAAATTPYAGENISTVYFKTSAASTAVTYTATSTSVLGCARVATVPVVVYQTAAPTGSQFYQFCPTGGATVSTMSSVLTGTNIKWYSASTGGTALAATTPLTQGYFWASQTANGCESPTRFLVFAISNATAAPSSTTSQQFCNSATVASLTANGTGLQWYTTATGGTALASTAALSTGTYYVSQTSGGCESPRTAVSVSVTAVSAPTGAATQSLSSLLTIGDIVVTGSNIVWYASAADAASGTSPLSPTQLLANTTYYATQTINGCRSATSLAVTITTLANQDFDMTQFTYYPNPVIDLLNISYSQDMTSVKVFNMIGQQLMSKQINSNTAQIDMSRYANGAYFIQVTTENAMKTVRVIKK